MQSLPFPVRPVTTGVRCIARVVGLGLVGLIALFLIAEGGLDPRQLTPRESVLTLFFLMTWLGLLLAWRWELLGGALATVGMLAFYLVERVAGGRFPGGWVFPLMLLTGILFLLSWFLEKRFAWSHRA